MDFDFSEGQKILRKAAREFLSTECPIQLVRSVEEKGVGYAPELWQKMAELGWLGLAVGEEFGGLGGSFMDMSILVEEMGRALAPVPFIPVALCEYALTEAGSREQKKRLLSSMASGQTIMTLALHDATLSLDPSGIEARAVRKGDGYGLTGKKFFVPYGAIADAYLVVARTGGSGEKGISLFVVDRKASGITVAPVGTIGSDAQCQLLMQDVKVGQDHLVGPEGEGWPILKRLLQRGAVLKCAEMVGGAQWVLDETVDYVKQRVQFDRPIGSFQAIQHKCANAAIACDGARFVTYQAAWFQSEELPCEREVAAAKAWVSDAYTRVCLESHQAHGAIGFTMEYDLQLYTRRAKGAELAFGDSRIHYAALADLMGLGMSKNSQ